MEQIRYYSRSPSVDRILILWHDPTLRPPRKMRLPSPIPSEGGSSSGDTLVDFIWQKSNSLNNRFRPSLLITTPSVLIMDDDMQVHLEDLDLLHAVWTRYPERIAGFFPRWHDVVKDSKNNPFLKYVTSDTGKLLRIIWGSEAFGLWMRHFYLLAPVTSIVLELLLLLLLLMMMIMMMASVHKFES